MHGGNLFRLLTLKGKLLGNMTTLINLRAPPGWTAVPPSFLTEIATFPERISEPPRNQKEEQVAAHCHAREGISPSHARLQKLKQPTDALPYLWLAGNEGRDKKTETAIMGYIGTTIRIRSFIPSSNSAVLLMASL